jgi:dTDP-4-dehydrorhamnose 3,5-epimerase-like enzyme
MSKGSIETYDIKTLGDDRGNLIAIENGSNIPFEIKRVYYIFDTKDDVERGFHAHINLDQVAIAVHGSCTFVLDDGKDLQVEVDLDSPNKALRMTNLIWREMKNFSSDCVLLVLASEYYDKGDYISDYDEFKRLANDS